METIVSEDKKLVEVWLTKAESQNPAVEESLKNLYIESNAQGYMVAVFRSGTECLYQNTLALLKSNRRRMVEREVQAERASKKSNRHRQEEYK